MSELPLFRNYSKTEAEQREMAYRKFLDLRASLDPVAREWSDRLLIKEYAESCEDAKTRIARRRQELLDQKGACLQSMIPEAREFFERKVGPAVRNGDYAAMDSACRGLETNNQPAERAKEIRRKTRQVFSIRESRDAAEGYMKLGGNFADLVKECGQSGQQAASDRGLRPKITCPRLRFLP